MNGKNDVKVADRVKETVIRTLELDLGRDQLSDRTPLYSSIVRLDSLTLLQLIVALEEELDIEIDDEDVMNTDLRDIGSLVGMVMAAMDSGGVRPDERRAADTGV